METASRRRGRAFAPAHVTGFFAPRLAARDPRARGSVGAGLVLGVGVTATVRARPGARAGVRFEGRGRARFPISEEAARRLLRGHRAELAVTLEHAVPIGRGFGASAAGALATALAVGAAVGEPRRRSVEVAHLADLFGRGGLGGVAAILDGGLEARLRPGIPPFGRVRHFPREDDVLVGSLGDPLASPRILADPRRLARLGAAEELVEEFLHDPDPERFWATAEAFTDRVGLASRPLAVVLRALRRRGCRAFQAMFGETFVAELPPPERVPGVLRWIASRRLGGRLVPVAAGGAERLPEPDPLGAP